MKTSRRNTDNPPIWYVYILRCSDDTYYTGITTDIYRRLAEHNSEDSVTRYTRTRRPVRLVHLELAADRSSATTRENLIKRMTRKGKERLVLSTLRQTA